MRSHYLFMAALLLGSAAGHGANSRSDGPLDAAADFSRLKALVGFDAATGEIEFKFPDATNLTPGAGHTHNVSFHLVDDQHFQSEWQFYENGKLKMSENPQHTRVR